MTKGKKHTQPEPLPPRLAELVERWRAEHSGEELPPILDPFPSIEAARAFRVREAMEERWSEAASDPPNIARDVETARSSEDETERAAAIERVAEWLTRKWRVPDDLKRVLARLAHERGTPESKPRRRSPTPVPSERKELRPSHARPATYLTFKREVLAAAAYRAMAEDHEPIPVSLRRVARGLGSFLPLTVIYGMRGPALSRAFGTWKDNVDW